MSKIGKKPINIPDNVEAKMSNGILEFKGTKGSLSVLVLPYIKAEMKDKIFRISYMGDIGHNDILYLLKSLEKVLQELNIPINTTRALKKAQKILNS